MQVLNDEAMYAKLVVRAPGIRKFTEERLREGLASLPERGDRRWVLCLFTGRRHSLADFGESYHREIDYIPGGGRAAEVYFMSECIKQLSRES
jgi:hypothetical protein